MIAAEGYQHILHFAARDRTPIPTALARITVCTVYAAALSDLSGEVSAALKAGEIDWVLLFSTRSAVAFAAACPDRSRVSIAAISDGVLRAAGSGWRNAVTATTTSELAILAAAGLTCDKQA